MGKKTKSLRIIFGFAIAIVLALFVGLAIDTFYESPEYKDFCNTTVSQLETKQQCENAGGKWQPSPTTKVPKTSNKLECTKLPSEDKIMLQCENINETMSQGYCNRDFFCRNSYDAAKENYNRNVFFIAVLIGLAIIFGATTFFGTEHISAGLLGGGVLVMIYGIIRYWGQAGDILRVIFLGLAFIALVWFAQKKASKKK